MHSEQEIHDIVKPSAITEGISEERKNSGLVVRHLTSCDAVIITALL